MTPVAWAAGEFLADYDVQYAVAPGGTTIVTQNITLTNQLSNVYPQRYSIAIDSLQIKNILAYDNLGIIKPDIKQVDGKTEITLTFNEKVAGLGKQLPFSLRYESADIAVKNGSIWEITIPGVAPDPDLSRYVVSLSVPHTFGENAYMSPLPAQAGKWTKEQMTSGGITAAYGTTQAFDLTLSYFLENPTVSTRRTHVALPHDSAFQKVYIKSLSPAPSTVTVDEDGNWMAEYDLLPTQRLEVKADLTVAISLTPRANYKDVLGDREQYIKQDKYWEANAQKVQELARTYTTPRDIYNYVVRTLSYDYDRISQVPIRKGASQALASPDNSICMEFTDVFIAIARAAGIPAREAVGYAHTTNARLRPLSFVSDVLHAWPEYYDEARQIWVPVDPTWADTTGGVNYFDKLDFNHVVFAHHGVRSEYPLPAGFYKKPGENSKDVQVTFAPKIPTVLPSQLAVFYDVPEKTTSGFTLRGQVYIENRSETALDEPIAVTIQSTPVNVATTTQLLSLPPYARVPIDIAISIPAYLRHGEGAIVTTAGETIARHAFVIVPVIYHFFIPIICALVVVIILCIAWIRLKRR